MPPSHRELDSGQSFDSPIPASPVSVPTLDAHTSFRSGDSDNIEHPLPPTASPSFPSADNTPDSSTLACTWPSQERLGSDILDKWEEKSWAKEVWKGNVTLDGEEARKWPDLWGGVFGKLSAKG